MPIAIAGWAFSLLLWLLHQIAPAVDIIRAFGQASPLITPPGIAMILFLAAVWIVQTREY